MASTLQQVTIPAGRETSDPESLHYMENQHVEVGVDTGVYQAVVYYYFAFFANSSDVSSTPFTPPFASGPRSSVHGSYSALVGFAPKESSACSDHDLLALNDSSTRCRWKKEPFIFATA